MPRSLVVLGTCAFFFACGGDNGATKGQPTHPAAEANVRMARACGDDGKTSASRASDVDGDGRNDVIRYYEQMPDPQKPGSEINALVRQDLDLNWDGRLDVCRYFDVDGKPQREELDLDFDGKIDEIRRYEGGVIVRAELDRNNDGRADIVRIYKDGKLAQKETDTNDDGKPDRWEYYSGKKLERVGEDLDHDGKIDRWLKSAG